MSHLDAPEYVGLGRTQMHDAAIEAGLVPTPQVEQTVDEANSERIEQLESAKSANPHYELEGKTSEELDELEDEVDETVLRRLKQKRLKELKDKESLENIPKVQALKEIQDNEFDSEVKQRSVHSPVVLLLYLLSHPESSMMEKLLIPLQNNFQHISVVKLLASNRIANFPLSDAPTVLVWSGGSKIAQFVRLSSFAGLWTTQEMIQYEMGKLGIIEPQIKENPYDQIIEKERQKVNVNVHRKGNRIKEIRRDSDPESD
jgi:hypothetical protein